MAWMMDTYSMNHGTTITGVVTGKPIHLGGSLGREKPPDAAFRHRPEVARRAGIEIEGAKVALQALVTSVAKRRACSPASAPVSWLFRITPPPCTTKAESGYGRPHRPAGGEKQIAGFPAPRD